MQKYILLVILTIATKLSFGQKNIPIDSVAQHIGDSVTVCSRVYGVKATDKITFINMGAPYPNSPLTVVVFAKDLPAFGKKLDDLISDKPVCVSGTIKVYKGKTEIVVTRPEDITMQ